MQNGGIVRAALRAGEAFDKVARLLGLELDPSGGAAVEAFARGGDAQRFRFSVPLAKQAPNCNFSYAGLKTAVRLAAQAEAPGPPTDANRQARGDPSPLRAPWTYMTPCTPRYCLNADSTVEARSGMGAAYFVVLRLPAQRPKACLQLGPIGSQAWLYKLTCASLSHVNGGVPRTGARGHRGLVPAGGAAAPGGAGAPRRGVGARGRARHRPPGRRGGRRGQPPPARQAPGTPPPAQWQFLGFC